MRCHTVEGNTMIDMIVTIKQVPDTTEITTQAMKPDGTVNRDALPAIVNPEDLNALEEALRIKDKYGGDITVITMGPPSATQALKECYYRGADRVILVSDKKFAAADTLATSYTLKKAIERIGRFDLIFCGRQAIDGDTAQVGPQLAEKLGINQITFVSEITGVALSEGKPDRIRVTRSTEYGFEILESPFPLLLTVSSAANTPRPPGAKRLMANKNSEFSPYNAANICDEGSDCFQSWDRESIGIEESRCGLAGSPTKVKQIEYVTLAAKETRTVEPVQEEIDALIHELRSDHIIG